MAILVLFVNPLTAVLTFASLIGYAVDLHRVAQARDAAEHRDRRRRRRRAAGARLGRGDRHASTGDALLLFLIIFVWTPPHFWALAIARTRRTTRAPGCRCCRSRTAASSRARAVLLLHDPAAAS